MSWLPSWSPSRVLLLILLKCATLTAILPMDESVFPRVVVAASHAALSGDLAVLILSLPPMDRPTTVLSTTTEDVDIVMEEEQEGRSGTGSGTAQAPLVLRVLRLDGFTSELVGEVAVDPAPPLGGNVSLTVPCGFLSRGGTYSLQLQEKNSPVPAKLTDISSMHDVQMRTTLDVRWPTPSLSLEPQHFETYPGQPVLATLEYTGISCTPSPGVPIATYSMQLIYCGSSVLSCDTRNKSHVQVLYSEEVKGFPAQRVVALRCELFGQSGHYALRLKPTAGNPTAPTTSAYIKVEWSDQFVFNVHARSVYPCDEGSGGISVLFEYPACRLQGDRVRVYGRLRADVASPAPPSTLHYLAELKAPPGKHTLTFDCDIFKERFVEYCFSYVSQAITGAMSQVRVDCIPTFPLQDGDAGGWGPWSQWTPCSSSCVGGTRHRYRFCDTPPPRYGAKFCQGQAVETEACGGSNRLDLGENWTPGDWECRYGKELAAEKPEVAAEVGTKCRCGCLVVLEANRTRRILAASTQACPGRSFWVVQAEADHRVRLDLDQARFPCKDQYVRVRDGDSFGAELLADVAFDKSAPVSGAVISTETSLLVEFFSDEQAAERATCVGGFLAHATMYAKDYSDNGTAMSGDYLNPKIMAAAGRWALWLTPAHMAAAILLVLIFLVSVFLALQYAFKYRKYEIAEDLDSLTDNSVCSGSMQGLARRARALSSATLISEVVSLVRLPGRGSPKHARLDEAPADLEDGYESTETQPDGGDDDEGSVGSGITLKNKDSDENARGTITPCGSVGTPVRRLSCSSSTSASGQPEVKYARPVKLRTAVGPISPVSEEPSTSDRSRRYSVTSASISPNNGFSPASTSSNISNLRCGKESKERRNRERLLQGPAGSEFSLANQDMDLELDYYDYNVVNAGAAPGSYLGMDPAFLVWIPPLDPGESEILRGIGEDHHYEEIPERRSDYLDLGSRQRLDTEGAALTPGEYKLIKETCGVGADCGIAAVGVGVNAGDGTSVSRLQSWEAVPKRIDPGESRLHDEIISEYKARLNEGNLPIHRILEESTLRVGDDSSLARHARDETERIQNEADVIPNRLPKKEVQGRPEPRFAPKANRNRLSEEEERARSPAATIAKDHGTGRDNCRSAEYTDSRRVKKLSRDEPGDRSITPGNPRGRFSDDFDGSKVMIHSSVTEVGSRASEAIVVKSFRASDDNGPSRTTTTTTTTTTATTTPSCHNGRKNNPDVLQSKYRRKDHLKRLAAGDLDRDHCDRRDRRCISAIATNNNPSAPADVQRRGYKEDVTELNVVSDVKIGNVVNIPLREFSRGIRITDSPARVHRRPRDNRKETNFHKQVQSPDYGVEADIMSEETKGFYDLIGEGEDGFKFADDDDDDYVDNKAMA